MQKRLFGHKRAAANVLVRAGIFLLAVIFCQLSLAVPAAAQSFFGGWEMTGGLYEGEYMSVDDVEMRVTLFFDEGYVGWLRIRTFSDGELISEETDNISYDVAQNGSLIIDDLGIFAINGSEATLYNEDDPDTEFYFLSWDAIDGGDDSVDPEDDPVVEPEPVTPAPTQPAPTQPAPTAPAPQPTTGTPRATGRRLTLVTRPPAATTAATTGPDGPGAQTSQYDQPFKDKPGVEYKGPFMLLADPAAYFADLPKLFDPAAEKLLVPEETLKAYFADVDKLEIDVWELETPEGASEAPTLAAAWRHLLPYPLMSADLVLRVDDGSGEGIVLSLMSPAMPGNRTSLAAGKRADSKQPLSLDTLQPLQLSLRLLDDLKGIVTVVYDFEQGTLEVVDYNYETALQGLRPAAKEERELCSKGLDSMVLAAAEGDKVAVSLVNPFAPTAREIRATIVRDDSLSIQLQLDEQNTPAGLAGGAYLTKSALAHWLYGLAPDDPASELLAVPLTATILQFVFPAEAGAAGDLQITYYPTLGLIRLNRVTAE